jgi:hypothetical protein
MTGIPTSELYGKNYNNCMKHVIISTILKQFHTKMLLPGEAPHYLARREMLSIKNIN